MRLTLFLEKGSFVWTLLCWPFPPQSTLRFEEKIVQNLSRADEKIFFSAVCNCIWVNIKRGVWVTVNRIISLQRPTPEIEVSTKHYWSEFIRSQTFLQFCCIGIMKIFLTEIEGRGRDRGCKNNKILYTWGKLGSLSGEKRRGCEGLIFNRVTHICYIEFRISYFLIPIKRTVNSPTYISHCLQSVWSENVAGLHRTWNVSVQRGKRNMFATTIR